ncbi:MAG TPA: macrolide 2'-phosphotransferase, partial [Polyangiaceae bacterium]|nr:macrolide 2'-phosphotransferase [Polyangiaceae bacterium]
MDLLESARREGLELETDAALCDESGLDFVVVHAHDASGTAWIVRRPRRPNVLESARLEARTLALVRPRLPVAVPDWRVFVDDVIAYPKLLGTTAVSFDPGAGPRWNLIDPLAPSAPFLDSLARAVAALQSIPLDEARDAGVRVSSLADERTWLAGCMQRTREALAPSQALWQRWHGWLESDATWPPDSVMVHGDLHPGHWLLGDDGRLTGILDWTAAQFGDPGTDFGLIHGAFGRSGLETLLDPFQRAGGKTWPGLLEHA